MTHGIRDLVPLALASCVLLDVPAGAQERREPRRRSVLFYLVDTCRRDRLGFEGYRRETTPFLSWLAERSVVFESCTSQAAWTKPSMASMLTSRYPSATGVYRMEERLPDELVTWPEVLHASGMYTAGFSANIVMGGSLSNFAQGFDHFVESTAINRGDPIRFASGSARKLNEHVLPWLQATDPWPMLLYVHSVDPHEEYEPEASYLERFADPDRHARFREEWKALLASRPPIPGLYVTQENFDRTGIDAASFIEHGSDLYDADVLANDDQMRVLWDVLQEDGWGDDLVFVFTSDHGEEFFEHGGTSHGYSLYEELVRVPLLIHAPGLLPEGKRITAPVRLLDVFPTLCELLGLEVPEGIEGRSLLPLIRGEETAAERTVFSEHREDPVVRRIGHGSGVLVSVRKGRWKFILNQTSSQLIERPRYELYDLERDPGERDNVAELHPELVEELAVLVAAFVTEHREGASAADWVPLDPAVLEQLRALGYVGDGEAPEPALPDLGEAIRSGDLEAARAALAAGVDPARQDELGVTPLSLAAMTGHVEVARLLLEAGSRVDVPNRDGATALMGAAFFGEVEALAFLLDRGADRNARSATGDTALGATRVPWNITEFLAGLLGIPLEREAVEAGRKECAELLVQEH